MSTTNALTKEATSRYADLKDMRVYYHDAGEGPVLLMLHGGGPGASGWSNFKQNLPALTPHFRVLLVDQPGFGLTDKPEHDENQWDLTARVLVQLLDHLGIDKVTPVGNSMGGAASLALALAHPDRVERLILMAPAGGAVPVTSLSPTAEGRILFTYYAPPGPSVDRTKELVHALLYRPEDVDPETFQERYEASIDPESQAYHIRMFKKWANGGMPDLWKRVDEITHETLLLWGREDRILPLDTSLLMLNKMANARLHVVPKCGHWVMTEHPREFEDQIVAFMRETKA
ncbi:4,5-9,10-diseco-3-hydroxy-5,9,17-trioxoandrosta-1(10),2-diene-4-oate hydrolase [Streptomyces humidus]|uniref:4,5-9,10-diseco-3-hydroxy-5,9, 17-trioxoandrosta-1(10),2-diene-4-oate hydrolase n=1 Tax=Streptomyces humidus TaxID=52259 RepID=A0A918L961_9ACTN|nr:alpha/beta fold hydrolase [Streptomyces humidus]GGS20601.1 4,5-9,10-diseco-3-hydroxy-5,9,17-trioxoandrosta-1(10),2-diene-4-oate hydrolase [Streptomyces humidus]